MNPLAESITQNIAGGLLRQELASARTTLGLALSHLESAYNVSGTLGASPADRLDIGDSILSVKEALAHLTFERSSIPVESPLLETNE